MWLSRPALIRSARYASEYLDYARHMPKEYIEKAKRTVPRKIYDNRFGAPPLIRWFLPPEDYLPDKGRPWESAVVLKNLDRVSRYQQKMIASKFFVKRHRTVEQIPDEKWTIFPGDLVQVMVGKDKGKQGVVLKVLRENNSVYVEGLHRVLRKEIKNAKQLGIRENLTWVEEPLDVARDEVKLVDPNSNEACDVEWVLNDSKDEYIRVSVQSGYEIPLPSQAHVTYEYLKPDAYVEVKEKDTLSADVLKRTYTPKLCSFEEEIKEEMGIRDDRIPKPTYWY